MGQRRESLVLSGPEKAIRDVTDRLAAAGLIARRVRTSHGFHSQAMDAVLEPFTEFLFISLILYVCKNISLFHVHILVTKE